MPRFIETTDGYINAERVTQIKQETVSEDRSLDWFERTRHRIHWRDSAGNARISTSIDLHFSPHDLNVTVVQAHAGYFILVPMWDGPETLEVQRHPVVGWKIDGSIPLPLWFGDGGPGADNVPVVLHPDGRVSQDTADGFRWYASQDEWAKDETEQQAKRMAKGRKAPPHA